MCIFNLFTNSSSAKIINFRNIFPDFQNITNHIMTSTGTIKLKNFNLDEIKTDFLYHIDINIPDTKNTADIQKQFGDVKFVCMGGTKNRMVDLANYLRTLLEPHHVNEELIDISAAGNRYAIFKVGPVLCCSHGVGMSTMSVILHELLKLVYYAKCQDPIFIRVGTSGGIGIEPGTVVISNDAYNGYLRNEHEIAILGQRVIRPASFDRNVNQALLKCSKESLDFKVILADTMGAECFYEGQGRLDGASCQYSLSDKIIFLQKCYDKGIRNIEMEATMFASLTKHVGVKAADICVTLINRLNGDQIDITKEQKHEFEQRPFIVVGAFIKQILGK